MSKHVGQSKGTILFAKGQARACIVIPQEGEGHGGEWDVAQELNKYLSRMTGVEFPICVKLPCRGLVPITVGPGKLTSRLMRKASVSLARNNDESFTVVVTDEGIALQGKRLRSTYYAAYAFLEMLGCRFLEPGSAGEVIPRKRRIKVPLGKIMEEPRLPYRNVELELIVCEGLQHTLDIIEWTLKNRGNMVGFTMFHGKYGRPILNTPLLFAEAKKRDLMVSMGGHALGMFLMLPEKYMNPGKQSPRDFDEFLRLLNQTRRNEPDLFAGASHRLKNTHVPLFCTSNPRVIDRFVRNLIAFLRNYPEVDVIRFGQNDRCNPCPCEKCNAGLKWTDYAERNFVFINPFWRFRSDGKIIRQGHMDNYFKELLPRVGKALQKHFPDKRFIHMSQGVATVPAVKGASKDIPPNVWFCRGNEGFDFRGDISAPCNKVEWTDMQDCRAGMGNHKFLTKELYASGLYWNIPCWVPHIVARNHRNYLNRFPNYIGSYFFTNPSSNWRLWSPSLYAFGRVLWDPDLDIEDLVEDYVGHAYAGVLNLGRRIYRLFSEYGPEIAMLHRCCWASPYAQYANEEAKLRASAFGWGKLLLRTVRKSEKLIQEIDRRLSDQDECFLAEWLRKDRICADFLLTICRLRLSQWKRLGLDQKDASCWRKDWKTVLREEHPRFDVPYYKQVKALATADYDDASMMYRLR